MIKVAITGNIASGKSEVQKILENMGYKVLDTDIVGHEILKTCGKIKTEFKDYDVFDDSGEISREKLGRLVFSNPELKKKLEQISHPEIRKKILEFFNKNKTEKLIFVGIPLLFEAKMEDIFDKILLIYADDEIRKQRITEYRGYSKEYADARMNCQLSQDIKKNLVDYTIVNNKDKNNLEITIAQFIKNYFTIREIHTKPLK